MDDDGQLDAPLQARTRAAFRRYAANRTQAEAGENQCGERVPERQRMTRDGRGRGRQSDDDEAAIEPARAAHTQRTTSVRLCARRSASMSGTSLMIRIAAAQALTGRQRRTAMESTNPVCSHMVPSTGSAPKPIATVASPKPRADSCTPGSEYRIRAEPHGAQPDHAGPAQEREQYTQQQRDDGQTSARRVI